MLTTLKLTSIAQFARAAISAPFLLRRMSSAPAFPKASSLVIEPTSSPQPKPAPESLIFGHSFTVHLQPLPLPLPLAPHNPLHQDHMLLNRWSEKSGWQTPVIQQFGNLSMHPASSVFHYALECFEGMKAYRDKDGNARLFRPDMNMKRLTNSARRMFLPAFDQVELVEMIKQLVKVDHSWIPTQKGYSMYIRPTFIATTPTLGVSKPTSALLYVVMSPVGPYYRSGFNPVRILAEDRYVRAWPGGTGDCKVGGNYAPTIAPQEEAAQRGFNQVLWLFGEDQEVTEVGTMNLFFYMRGEDGVNELVTAPLNDIVLPGVTRDSIIHLARQNNIRVSERKQTMKQLIAAMNAGRVLEAFGAGTACVVSPVKEINFKGTAYSIPLGKEPESKSGPMAQFFWDELTKIQYSFSAKTTHNLTHMISTAKCQTILGA